MVVSNRISCKFVFYRLKSSKPNDQIESMNKMSLFGGVRIFNFVISCDFQELNMHQMLMLILIYLFLMRDDHELNLTNQELIIKNSLLLQTKPRRTRLDLLFLQLMQRVKVKRKERSVPN